MRLISIVPETIIGIIIITTLIPVVENINDDNILDVIILDGQSNAEYNTSLIISVQGDLPNPEHKLYYYGSETNSNMYPGYPNSKMNLMNRDDTWIISGIEAPLAYYYSVCAGHDVYVINIARGGASIETLRPEGSNGIYGRQILTQALSEIPDYYKIHMAGWVMIQGEADKETPVAEYKQYFLELSNYFDSIGVEKCYISTTRSYYGGNATIAQNELAQEYENIIIASTASDTFNIENRLVKPNDPIHYSQAGRNIIAADLAKVMSGPSQKNTIMQIIPILMIIGIMVPIIAGIINYDKKNLFS